MLQCQCASGIKFYFILCFSLFISSIIVRSQYNINVILNFHSILSFHSILFKFKLSTKNGKKIPYYSVNINYLFVRFRMNKTKRQTLFSVHLNLDMKFHRIYKIYSCVVKKNATWTKAGKSMIRWRAWYQNFYYKQVFYIVRDKKSLNILSIGAARRQNTNFMHICRHAMEKRAIMAVKKFMS